MSVFTVNVVTLSGDIVHSRDYDDPFTVNEVIEFARSAVDINSRWAESVAYAEVWWTGTLVHTFTPEWLEIPDEEDDDWGPSPEMEECWDAREEFYAEQSAFLSGYMATCEFCGKGATARVDCTPGSGYVCDEHTPEGIEWE